MCSPPTPPNTFQYNRAMNFLPCVCLTTQLFYPKIGPFPLFGEQSYTSLRLLVASLRFFPCSPDTYNAAISISFLYNGARAPIKVASCAPLSAMCSLLFKPECIVMCDKTFCLCTSYAESIRMVKTYEVGIIIDNLPCLHCAPHNTPCA